MIKVNFTNQYRKAGTPATATTQYVPGKLVFVYELDGTPEQHAEYKKVKGANYRENDKSKKPLFFATRLGSKTAEIKLNEEGNDYNLDTTRIDQLASLTVQFGLEVAEKMMSEFDTAS